MSMEQWWNETDTGKLKFSEKKLSPFDVIHHECHMGWPGIETVSFEDAGTDI
jgi:hypothetical protein